MKALKQVLMSAILLCIILPALQSCKKNSEEPVLIKFGAVLPLTGPDSDEGKMAKAAIETAINDLNSFMNDIGSDTKYSCEIMDMQSNAASCLEQVKSLRYKGIQLLLGGPYNSDELETVRSYLNEHEMLMLNAYCTSPSLSIANDNIFRLVPDDQKQAGGIVSMLHYQGIQAIVPIYVDDLYGNGLKQNISSGFQLNGGIVIDGIPFSPGTTGFNTEVAALDSKVQSAITAYGSDKVAVIIITGEETYSILNSARNYPALASVRWIGTDGSACQNSITDNPSIAEFAHQVNFVASVYEVGMTLSGEYIPSVQKVMNTIYTASGLVPNSNTLNVYDAVKIYAAACQAAGNSDFKSIKQALPEICRTYCTGDLTVRELNDSGDIANPVYGFWGVIYNGNQWKWRLKAHYWANNNKILEL